MSLKRRNIQRNLRPRKINGNLSKSFAKLMMEGRVNVALRLLSDEQSSGVLDLSEDIVNVLKEKHPLPADVKPDSLLYGPLENRNNFTVNTSEQKIEEIAHGMKGAAGPSQLDATQFRRILCSKQFQREGKDLRDQIALLANKLATEILDPSCLEAYTANHLIPLDKNPGVRPIGVGEILRRVVGKAIACEPKQDVKEAAGPIQVCAGHKAGAEAAIQAMQSIFLEENSQGVLLIDASNAFNSLNRRVALHNVQILCPRASTILINTYRCPSRLFITGGGEIQSQEGTTQGDPLAIPFYAVSTSLLISLLHSSYNKVRYSKCG